MYVSHEVLLRYPFEALLLYLRSTVDVLLLFPTCTSVHFLGHVLIYIVTMQEVSGSGTAELDALVDGGPLSLQTSITIVHSVDCTYVYVCICSHVSFILCTYTCAHLCIHPCTFISSTRLRVHESYTNPYMCGGCSTAMHVCVTCSAHPTIFTVMLCVCVCVCVCGCTHTIMCMHAHACNGW